MKKISILALVLLLTGPMAFSQIDKLMPHFGFMYEMITYKRSNAATADRPPIPYYGLNVGANYVLMHSNDQFSLGVDPNINFAIFPTNYGGLGLLAQAPVFLLGRVGANSTSYNQQKVGLGAGIGLNYTYVRLDPPSGSVGLNHSYVAPAALVELNLNLRSATYILRGHWNLTPTTLDYAGEDYDFGNFGFGIVYGF